MMVPLSEQETVIQFNREGDRCTIWTSDSTMITKLKNLCKSAPENYRLIKETKTRDGEPAGNYYELTDKGLITFRSRRVTLNLSEEQKQKLRERALSNFKNKPDSLEPQSTVENYNEADEEIID